jgi:hypothetical protein
MEHSLNILQQKATHGEERMKGEVQKKVAENASLICELNDLRRDNWDLRAKVIQLEVSDIY